MARILAVKIKKAINEDRKDLYEATRGNWIANRENTIAVQYVVGIYEGKVLSAYQPTEWQTVIEDGSDQERRRFNGETVNADLFRKIKNREEFIYNQFGSGSAIAYVDLDNIE